MSTRLASVAAATNQRLGGRRHLWARAIRANLLFRGHAMGALRAPFQTNPHSRKQYG
jgi:hypothetical protein